MLRIIVYSPQILENYQLQSGEGLSVAFVVVWLLGDIFGLVGAILADLLPTVIILAAYVSKPCDVHLISPLSLTWLVPAVVYSLRLHSPIPDLLLPMEAEEPTGPLAHLRK